MNEKWIEINCAGCAGKLGFTRMNVPIRLVSCVMAFVWICFPGQAANWYVDNAASGANNGTSWANAWTGFASVVWGASGVKAGDTLYISGGSSTKVYTEVWTVGASGTATGPIRVAIDAANPSHNGTAIFDYNSRGDTATVNGITCARSYVTFDGNVGGECHLAICNLRNQLDRASANGIQASSTTGVIVDHVAFTNCNNPVRISSSTKFKISNSQLRQVRGAAAIAAGGSSGSWDANVVCSNVIEILYNNSAPPGRSGYVGPDGVQCGSGMTFFGNTFLEKATSVYTSDEHPDMFQATGNYIKIYGNEFVNVGDSVFDYDCYANANPHDIWIYNNVFRITTSIDPYPEYFRMYASINSVASINNVKILNNTFVDNTFQYRTIWFGDFKASPTGSGNEIKNNIFYNCGGGNSGSPVIYVDDSAGFTSSTFTFDGNIYYRPSGTAYIYYRGTSYTAANWVSAFEPNGKTAMPKFVSYVASALGNDFHLQSSDTVAKDAGLNLGSFFGSDKDGVARPQGIAWDIGAFEFGSGGPTDTTAPTVLLQAINPIVADTVQLAAVAVDEVGGSGVANVTFLVDGNAIASDTSLPYSSIWDSRMVTNGAHVIQARAQDAAGNLATSSAVIVTVQNRLLTLREGLVGYWPFNEESGNTAPDISGGNNHGTLLNGASWSVGKLLGALALDGVDDCVRVPSTPNLERVTNAVSICAWIKVDANTAIDPMQTIARKVLAESTNVSPYSAYDLVIQDFGGTFKPRMGVSRSDAVRGVAWGATRAYGVWCHLAGVYDGSAVRIYVNGMEESSTPFTGSLLQTSQPLYIGRYGTVTEAVKGIIDDFRLYERALSAGEIQTLYNSTVPAPPSDLRTSEN